MGWGGYAIELPVRPEGAIKKSNIKIHKETFELNPLHHSAPCFPCRPQVWPRSSPDEVVLPGATWGRWPEYQAAGAPPDLHTPAQMRPGGWGWTWWCQPENQRSGFPTLLPAYTKRYRTQNLSLWHRERERGGGLESILVIYRSFICMSVCLFMLVVCADRNGSFIFSC